MPLDVKFDEDKRLIQVIVSGTWPTLPEIVAERSRLILAGMIRPGVVELVDTRGVTRGIPNLSQMQAILQSIGKPPDKRAIVVARTCSSAPAASPRRSIRKASRCSATKTARGNGCSKINLARRRRKSIAVNQEKSRSSRTASRLIS